MDTNQADAQVLREQAIAFIERYLSHAIDDASRDGQNPVVVLYALLECAMRVAHAHFPEHADSLYASATQMVFEAYNQPDAIN